MELLHCNCASLRSATRVLSLAYDEALRPSGLKISQFSVLSRIGAVGPITQVALAELLGMDRTTLGRNLRPLERDGYVITEVGDDRRERLINLTSLGQKKLIAAIPMWKEVQERFEVLYGGQESKKLRNAMKSLVRIGRELVKGQT